jgi:glycosyltransferase involved in cell wall biosynthesis
MARFPLRRGSGQGWSAGLQVRHAASLCHGEQLLASGCGSPASVHDVNRKLVQRAALALDGYTMTPGNRYTSVHGVRDSALNQRGRLMQGTGLEAIPRPTVSVVVPVFNEVESLPAFHRRATAALQGCADSFEIIFVDDGSNDGSLDELRRLVSRDDHVRVVSFSRNFGHQTAVTAGMNYSNGAAVVVIDSDLQDPPELIADLLARWREGYQVVYAVRRNRKEHWLKRTAYQLFYRLLQRLSYVDMPLDSGDFAIMDRCVVDLLNDMPERNRFVRGIRAWVGFRQMGIEYDRQPRRAGTSKYSFAKLTRLAYDGVVSYSFAPLRLVTQLGFLISAAAFASMVYILGLKILFDIPLLGWTSTIVVILFLGGAQLVSLGILGEYIARIFDEVKCRPLYVVKDLIGFDSSPPTMPPASPPGAST